MAKQLRALILALTAIGALAAVSAAGAQAQEYFHVHSPVERNVITAHGEGLQTFTIYDEETHEPIEQVKCAKLTAEGDEIGTFHKNGEGVETYTSTQATVGFKYEECESGLDKNITVISTGCHYKLTAETDENGHGEVHIENCENGIQIKGTNTGCTITVPNQTPHGGSTGNGVHYKNVGTTEEETITGEATVDGITYKANFICQLGGIPKEGTNSSYVGNFETEAHEYLGGATGSYEVGETVPLWYGPTI